VRELNEPKEADEFGDFVSMSGNAKIALISQGIGLNSKSEATWVFTNTSLEVDSAAPNHGVAAGGTSVDIRGINFTGATSVHFGSAEASFTVNSAESITATAPAGTGTVPVTVSNGGGAGRTVATYTYGPVIEGVSPGEGPLAAGTSVVISGGGFSGVTAVKFGATNATSYTVTSEEAIEAVAPAGTAGNVDVTVTTGEGTSPAVSADRFAYVAKPAITKVKPNKGFVAGGETITITGTSFRGVTAVKFGSTPAASYAVLSETSISAVVPAESVGKVNVSVTGTGGTTATVAADAYTFEPRITGLSPNGGPVAGGTTVTVTGSGFALGSTATAIKFGTSKAKVNCTSTTECTATSPAHAAGTVEVKATVNKVTSPAKEPADLYTYS
jgi:hypothetical protein